MPPPRFERVVIVGDDALQVAEIAALLGRRTGYLPILNGPRLQRPDPDHEVIRRHNAIAAVQPNSLLLAGLPDATCELFLPLPRSVVVRRVQHADEVIAAGLANRRLEKGPLPWSRSHVGVGLVQALKSRRRLLFCDVPPPATQIGMDASHIVVCEDGDAHAQVVAAAYAMSIDAGLCVIPEFQKQRGDDMLEALYGLSEAPDRLTRLDGIRRELRAHVGDLGLARRVVTFVTARLPWGPAFDELATTHLFRYPDRGIAIINAIAAEKADTPGIRSAVVISPLSVDAADTGCALVRLTNSGVLSKSLPGDVATVHQASNTINLFPYDLLLIAAHCGDASGDRCTYEFVDSDGRPRRLVVDVAVGVKFKPHGQNVSVMEFNSFVSLDGVDWADQEGKAALPVGAATVAGTHAERRQIGRTRRHNHAFSDVAPPGQRGRGAAAGR